jgi:hypothetical protein
VPSWMRSPLDKRRSCYGGLLNLLGADIEKLEAPFIPEGGAYGHGRTHSHSHNHSHQPTTAIYTSDGDPNVRRRSDNEKLP